MHRRSFLTISGVVLATLSFARRARRAWGAGPGGASAAAVRGTLRRLTDPGAGDNRATYMPDGRRLLFASRRSGLSQVWSMDRDGGKVRRVHESGGNDYGRIAPNADGMHLAFSTDRSGQNVICVLDLKRGTVTAVSDPAFWSFGPTWSSRDLIAFFSRKGGNVLNTWTVRPDGSGARQITNRPGESRQPWWSPDGDRLALSADEGRGTFQIRLMAADGTAARLITEGGTFQQPFWSPDGRRLAVSAKRTDEPYFRIYVLDADGTNVKAIHQPEDIDNVHPAWSPDGLSIVFTSGRGAAGALWRFDLA
jgi:Tol biopolymer transport system component